METNDFKIPKRILGSLLTSLSAGVVPRSGASYVAIGRNAEVTALASDLDRTADGGAAMRFIVGRYGSGKSFLIQLARSAAMERGFVCADADLSPERRLCGSDGAGLATYRELVRNLSCKASPDGGALPVILSKWISSVSAECAAAGLAVGSPEFDDAVSRRIYDACRTLEGGVGGFDFAYILSEYFKAYSAGNDERCSVCIRWLRGEYSTRTEARGALGVRTLSVISDDNWYDYLKLIASFVRIAGYSGLAVFIDEGVNLYKIVNHVSREQNYEKLLAMYNDALQGRAEGLMIVIGGTPQFLEDTRRGLFSYDALRSRLSDSSADTGLVNLMSPVLRLKRLSDSELYALILRLSLLHSKYYNYTPKLTDSEMEKFLRGELSRAGADAMITPREIIRDFLGLLDLIYQNPDESFENILEKTGRGNYLSDGDGASDAKPDPASAPDTSGAQSSGERVITADMIEF